MTDLLTLAIIGVTDLCAEHLDSIEFIWVDVWDENDPIGNGLEIYEVVDVPLAHR